MDVPASHPRKESLETRHKIVEGIEQGITSTCGLIAHGRGEAFDYLIGEQTIPPADKAIHAAVSKLLQAKHPVLSVNGNVAVLVPEEYIALGKALNAPLEINLFYRTPERMKSIEKLLHSKGCECLLTGEDARIGVESERRKIDSQGQAKADVILVPLEDGDRTEALKRAGKYVITIDLNPLSRTARQADITIVDNITRAVPLMIKYAEQSAKQQTFNNKENLEETLEYIKRRLNGRIFD
ncbi:phosphopantothenate/pantothenate synthetase [archaeon]|nr:phosphopantothenate/pantothenate synthetase [archaeon]